MPSTLHITNYQKDKYVSAIRAIRIARTDLGEAESACTLVAARDTIDRLRDTGEPQYVGQHDAPESISAALRVLHEHACEGELNLIVESHETGQEVDDATAAPLRPAEDDSGEVVSLDTACATLVFMALCQGNPAYARAAAGSMKLATQDEIWDEVAGLLKFAFPTDPSDPTAGYDIS